jgi:hypothetical protein
MVSRMIVCRSRCAGIVRANQPADAADIDVVMMPFGISFFSHFAWHSTPPTRQDGVAGFTFRVATEYV